MLSRISDENISPRAAGMTSAPRKSRGDSRSKMPKSSNSGVNKKRGGSSGLHMREVDVLTGQRIQMVYFNPDLAIGLEGPQTSKAWRNDHSFEPAGVISEDQTTGVMKVRLRTGEMVTMDAKNAQKVSEQDKQGEPDILKLRDFSAMSLIHTLRTRYKRDEIYTFVGPILISINPYKWFKDLYSEHTMVSYHGRKRGELPPHLFVVADCAYHSLMAYAGMTKGKENGVKDQAIIISGESGAGKTEATKVIMTFLARITMMAGGNSKHSQSVGNLEQRVLNTNPMLEAFGNAKTLRNDNSSRFGKYIKIQFSQEGRIVGASMERYLLEKTRVIEHMEGERNFHIFYQLLRGSSQEELEALRLTREVNAYRAISSGNDLETASVIPSVSDSHEFHLTRGCMNSVGIDETQQKDIFALLAGILHMGNLAFVDKDDEAVINELTPEAKTHLGHAATLFGFSQEALLNVLTKQNIHVGGSTIVKFVTTAQSNDKRASFCKSVYSMLFNWLFEKINSTIAVNESSAWGVIGVLDIYGFENFDHNNGFEQLLINYANEKLQNHFNKHIFAIEQQEYSQEGIDWSYIHFNDNQSCVDLIDGRPDGKSGIFCTLDDSISFVSHLNQQFASGSSRTQHLEYISPRFNSDTRFGIVHYAGEVFYEVAGFAEKNRDSTNNDMKTLMATSDNSLLQALAQGVLMQEEAAANAATAASALNTSTSSGSSARKDNRRKSSVSKLREDSISKQFVSSLSKLYDMLHAAEPHYVRCVKPNDTKTAERLQAVQVMEQLNNAGMMETIRIRRQGYAMRMLHTDFFTRYAKLSPRSTTLTQLISHLSAVLNVGEDAWQVGHSKVFFRSEMSDKLDQLLWICYTQSARRVQRAWKELGRRRATLKIQKMMRKFLVSVKFQRIRHFAIMNQSMLRMYKSWLQYQQLRFATMSIQRWARGCAGRKVARELRNPYNNMTYDDLSREISALERELDGAMKKQQFKACDGLHSRIAEAERVRNRLEIPDVIPESRAHLELLISASHFAIAHARSKGPVLVEPEEIDKLSLHHQKLTELRASFPSLSEMQQQLAESQSQLEVAMDRKDFRQCAALNAKIEILETQLKDPINSMGCRRTKVQIESRIDEVQAAIETALKDKAFDVCSTLQTELDSLQLELSARRMDLASAENRLAGLRKVLAVKSGETRQNYLEMAKLKEEVGYLTSDIADMKQAALEAEKAAKDAAVAAEAAQRLREEQQREKAAIAVAEAAEMEAMSSADAESRAYAALLVEAARPKLTKAEIESEIKSIQAQLDEALSAKRYQECEELNRRMEEMTVMRDTIPTAASVMAKIKGLEAELQECIAKKAYAQCEGLEKDIEALKQQHKELVEVELSMMPPPAKIVVKPATSTATPSKVAAIQPSSTAKKSNDKKVSKLRPRPPVTGLADKSILEIAEIMAHNRVDAALLVDSEGSLQGILTDNDITRRVVSQFVSPHSTCVSDVMTAHPKCVCNEDSALDALETMVDNRFRHLPVLDEDGSVVGLLDIAKCLYEAISALEHIQESEESRGPDADSMALVGAMASALQKAGGAKNKAQMAAMQAMMEQMFGGSMPTLRTIIGEDHYISVRSSDNVREAAAVMAKARKGVLVVDEGELVGIFTPKDMLSRVIAKGLSPDVTAVSSVMTPNPDCVSPDLTLLDALREMHDHKFLHLPVREADGRVLGLVDVMELVCNSAGGDGKGWRDFFSGALDARGDGIDDTLSEISGSALSVTKSLTSHNNGHKRAALDDASSDIFSMSMSGVHSHPDNNMPQNGTFVFKLTDNAGQTHRLKASASNYDIFIEAVAEKMGAAAMEYLTVMYQDDDGDEIVVDSSQALQEAVEFARNAGVSALKLKIGNADPFNQTTMVPPSDLDMSIDLHNNKSILEETFDAIKNDKNTQIKLGASVAAMAVIAGAFMVLVRAQKK